MKKALFTLFLLPSLMWGLVVESGKMKELLSHVGEETWVLIDVDNTLIESSIQLGSAQWRNYIRKKAENAGYSKEEAELVLDEFWLFVQPFVPVNLVDSEAKSVVDTLKKDGVFVVALTARDPIEAFHTAKQLASVKLDLSNTFLSPRLSLPLTAPALYQNGVVYCGENTKSSVLKALFKASGKTPRKIVFVDDKMDQINDLKSAFEHSKIEFVGIRFSAADARVKAFNGKIADLEWSLLPQIISD